MPKPETEKRYEAVVKHYLQGVLHIAYFEDLNKAHNWLMNRWAELGKGARDGADSASTQVNYAGAIYDQDDERKRMMLLGAEYVLARNHSE